MSNPGLREELAEIARRTRAAGVDRQLLMQQVCAAIQDAYGKVVVIVAHVNPDADALGSALALGLGLQTEDCEVTVTFGHPGEVPESLRELPGQQLIAFGDDVPEAPDLVISVDVSSIARLGAADVLFATAADSICIDHHASNDGFGRHHLVDPSASSTANLVAEVLADLGIDLDRAMAANLYAGLATDTGNFRFARPEDHTLAAELLEHRVDAQEVLRPIMDTHPLGWLNMLSKVLRGTTFYRTAVGGDGLVVATIRLADSKGLRQEELDSVIDIIRTTAEAEVAAVLKETDRHVWAVSMRAKSGADVGAVAIALGGGGHPRAAGYNAVGGAHEVRDALIAALAR